MTDRILMCGALHPLGNRVISALAWRLGMVIISRDAVCTDTPLALFLHGIFAKE